MREIVIDGRAIAPGERASIHLPVARLKTTTEISMPVRVIRGKRDGPTLFVSAAVHGDEINGVEIIRRLLRLQRLRKIRGTLIAVPMVNVFGLNQLSRYLPDRRDLNRSFPGSEGGSLAARLAGMFMSEIVSQSTHGIDLHTGAIHRSNLPQIRVSFQNEQALRLAKTFGAPVVLDASVRDGSLRGAVSGSGVPVVLYEAGEALRFDEWAIRPGLRGIVAVMQEIGMFQAPAKPRRVAPPLLVRKSVWVRAPDSGILSIRQTLGARVAIGTLLGMIGDPFGDNEVPITSPVNGIIIGKTNLPLLNEGDAVFHIACVDDFASASMSAFVESFQGPVEDRLGFDPEFPGGEP